MLNMSFPSQLTLLNIPLLFLPHYTISSRKWHLNHLNQGGSDPVGDLKIMSVNPLYYRIIGQIIGSDQPRLGNTLAIKRRDKSDPKLAQLSSSMGPA